MMKLIKKIRNKIMLRRFAKQLADWICGDENHSEEEIRKEIEHSKDVMDELKTE